MANLSTLPPTGDAAASEPPEDPHRPVQNKEAFDCPHCGAFAHQRCTIGVDEGEWVTHGKGRTRLPYWHEAICTHCELPSVWRREQMVYPMARLGGQPHEDMPAEARDLYLEAATVAAVSRRAGAALARCTLERLIKIVDPDAPPKANLETRIERLRPRITRPLGDLLDVVRVTGNGALHVEDQPGELVVMALHDEEGPELLELLLQAANDLVEELITRPSTTSGLWAKLPETIQARLQQLHTQREGQ